MLNSQFGDFTDVVVTLFITETSETQGGLTTTTVLLGEVDGEFVDDFTGVTGDSTEKGTVTVHDDETKFRIGFEELLECFGVEFVVTKVKGTVEEFVIIVNLCVSAVTYVLIGLCGSKSNETFFSFPSSVRMVPTKSTRPFGGTRL